MKLVGKRFLFTIATLVFIGVAATVAVLMAKGYTFSSKQGGLVGSGIISVASTPDGASVYIDGHLTTATNTNISGLTPKKYNVKIIKEGFIPWEKEVEVGEGIVSEVKATLFPALPTIYPLTYNGVLGPVLSPDGEKLAFAVPLVSDSPTRQKGGIWVWTMTSQPIALARSGEPHQIVASTTDLDFSKGTLRFSPDSTQVLVSLGTKGAASERNYLLPTDRQSSLGELRDITATVTNTLKEWETDQKAKDDLRVLAIKNLETRKIASASSQLTANSSQPSAVSSQQLRWSPDETKFIVDSPQPTANGKQQKAESSKQSAKVYDLVMDKSYDLPEAKVYFWLPDSKHIILVQEGKVAISEYDGLNVATIYAGSFENSFVFPWPDASRLVILTTFNTPTASTPNLFGINLK
ncbi:hypothetical protein A3E45_04325 [Candidatus Daviesbacteria bacterium RIFCSPHIGHO2_12_FULL_43_11]|uniref:PEGA domain-containing protein n=1 Tax=Candidatus Daviesbacteria bacterium RIFCSPHIGHO2_12_FULL_43_11 TaxID=1797780 RepID=A0A1F5K5N0_9BACT|nr:MAG: hypothetical protein A2874_02555 [Candidatus Daviesbacteria bacterium RIFCSPHIGHO2_01_FULL_43_17]OGE36283.1 MAG: hypothetical protein A3E45_04325 [Candidatus Daviesbacteria bacterium RIFCSPHIGHO2_12_FULL_43_11]